MEKPIDILREKWGYPAFRPLQEEIIQSVLDGQDTLALMPTGGGKSLCYQVPALCREGVCIVVSPLIALMQDQVRQLVERDIPAAAIHSGMRYDEIDRIFDNAVYGSLKLLYLSPERLQTEMARARIPRMPVNLLAVDEAHCISQWGYDFRPAYLNIAEAREWLPDVPVLALTATARPQVANDICERLEFGKNQQRFEKSFLRENLSYVVLREEGKEEALLRILSRVGGSAIVYTRNRRHTRETAAWLGSQRVSADFYHAGLSADQRSEKQQAWIEGRIRVMVSTNAFGMGIDKPDVRAVVHLDLPDSPEAYFQEAGRAGRDGQRSYAVLLYHEEDLARLEYQMEARFPPLQEVQRVYRALGSFFQLAVGGGEGDSHSFDLVEFCRRFKFKVHTTYQCLKVLQQNGWLLLTDPVYRPATYRITMDREKVYDYQLRHPKFEPVLKSLLRINAGAFHHPVPVRESRLAKYLRWETPELIRALQAFDRDDVIDYQPAIDQAQLVFLRERVPTEQLFLDHALLNERKRIYQEQIAAMREYLSENKCRNRALLDYFGQKLPEPCGICDLCLARKQGRAERQKVAGQLEALLRERPRTETELLEPFSTIRRELVREVLHNWIDEGLIERVDGKIRRTDSKRQP